MKTAAIFLLLSSLCSCGYNKHLRSVIADLESTPPCDTTNILVHPKDTKKTLAGKVIVLNDKLDCHSDNVYYTTKKLDSYKDL